jgi:polysaccharide export outer membrane protein
MTRLGKTLAISCRYVILAAAAVCISPPVVGQMVEIEALSISEVEDGLELRVRATRELDWTAEDSNPGILEIYLAGAFPGPGVEDLAPPEGLVLAVTARLESDGANPATRLEIQTRGTVTYAVREDEMGLVVSLGDGLPSNSVGEELLASAIEASEYESFRIGPRDSLQIEVFGASHLDRNVRVLSDGTVALPLLGTFTLAGLSLMEAESKIEGLLIERDLVRAPQVSIFVEEMVSRGVYVQGAVSKPGTYQLSNSGRLMDVLGEAGGLLSKDAERADRYLYILRSDPNGQQARIEIDAQALINEGDVTQNVPLRPGDIIMVPFTKTFKVYVTGAVVKPGAISFNSGEGISLLQAVTAASGPNERANLGKVIVIRTLEDGTQSRTKIDLKKIQKGKRPDFPLQQNDVVVVSEWFI